MLPSDHPVVTGVTADSTLVRATRGQSVTHTPVWLMRQAGRSLPEYRQLRSTVSMMDACFSRDAVTEITLQPVRRHGVDAAIFFSDIVVPLRAIGLQVDIVAGTGPVFDPPVRTAAGLAALRDLDESDVEPILGAVDDLVEELGPIPLIGFVGAPFTVASYLIEGRPSRDHLETKALMLGNPSLWHELLDRIARICGQFLRLQVLHGASVVQVFDSWAGALSRADYERFVLPHTRTVFDAIGDLPVPKIHFAVGAAHLLTSMATAGNDVMGIDFRRNLAEAIDELGGRMPVQGNLDPAYLFTSAAVREAAAREIIADGRSAPGHVFNLGHGVPPTADPEVITDLVAFVHESSRRGPSDG